MEKKIHRAEERGKVEAGWLRSRYSFSFARYYNPERMGFGLLRVLNDDIIEPGRGFDTHPHENMEIVTVVLEGALAHKDNSGGEGVIKPGEVQVMSAGSGVMHSEFNNSKKEKAKLLQIWIETKEDGIKPRYGQKAFRLGRNKLNVLASGEKGKGLYIHQDAVISRALLDKGKEVKYNISGKDNGAYVFVIEGRARIADEELGERDAIGVWNADSLEVSAPSKADVLILDVPMM